MNLLFAYPSVLNTGVSSFQGVRIDCIQRGPHFRGLE